MREEGANKNLFNVGSGAALASTDFMLSLTDRSGTSNASGASLNPNLPTLNMLSEISRNMGFNMPTIFPINNILTDTSHLLFNNGQLLSPQKVLKSNQIIKISTVEI